MMNKTVYLSHNIKGLAERIEYQWLTTLLSLNSIPFTENPGDIDQCSTVVVFLTKSYILSPSWDELQRAISAGKKILLTARSDRFAVPYGLSARTNFHCWWTDRTESSSAKKCRQKVLDVLRLMQKLELPHLWISLYSLSCSCQLLRFEAAERRGDPGWTIFLDLLIHIQKMPFPLVDLIYPEKWDPALELDEDGSPVDPSERDDDFECLGQFCRFLTDELPASLPEIAEEKPAEPLPEPVPIPEKPKKRRIPSLIRESTGDIIELPEGIFYIGSDPLNCGYCLEMPDVRDRHLAFRTEHQTSYVSEAEIETANERPLSHGDLITVGEEQFIFRYL